MNNQESGSTDTLSVDDLSIPGYLTYVVIVYRLFCTTFIVGMGSLIISTIVKTRALHNVHNILIVNLMAAEIVGMSFSMFLTIGMMLSYITGVPDLFRCDMLSFFHFPFTVVMYTFVMISVDKFIAIKFALRYKTIVTHRRAYLVIAIGWIIALLIRSVRLIYELAADTKYDKSSQFGSCLIQQQFIFISLFTTIIPIIITCSITITLDAYLSIKAYQMFKKIQKENGEEREIFKDGLNKILQQLKPMITLLVTILGSMAIALVGSTVHATTSSLMMENESFQLVGSHLFLYNIGYLTVIVHPVVYGLYFRDIRQSLCKRVKHMAQRCKFNTIAPSQASSSR